MDVWQILSRGSDVIQVLSAAVAIAFAAQANTLRRRYLFQLRVPKILEELSECATTIFSLLGETPLQQTQLHDSLSDIATKLASLQKRLQFWSRERREVKKLCKATERLRKTEQLPEFEVREIYRSLRATLSIVNNVYEDFQLR
jgi:hypothetical protein